MFKPQIILQSEPKPLNQIFCSGRINSIDLRRKYYYWLSGDLLETDEDSESDVCKVTENYISITPIVFDMTHAKLLAELKDKFHDNI